MLQILLGSIVLSLVHAAIPNHWIPLVAVGRAQQWTRGETIRATIIAGLAHSIGTVGLGVLVGFVGLQLAHEYEETALFVTPMVLLLLGMIYIVLDIRKHRHRDIAVESLTKKSRSAIIASLAVAMFFSPCLEITGFYLSAGAYGGLGILVVSLVYLTVTVLGMVTLVYAAIRGVERVRWHFLEHHEYAVSGVVLVILGLVALLTGGHAHPHTH